MVPAPQAADCDESTIRGLLAAVTGNFPIKHARVQQAPRLQCPVEPGSNARIRKNVGAASLFGTRSWNNFTPQTWQTFLVAFEMYDFVLL